VSYESHLRARKGPAARAAHDADDTDDIDICPCCKIPLDTISNLCRVCNHPYERCKNCNERVYRFEVDGKYYPGSVCTVCGCVAAEHAPSPSRKRSGKTRDH